MKKILCALCMVAMCLLATMGTLSCTKTKADFKDVVDFTVEVESGRDIRVLQLTDPQIIDASQKRYYDRSYGTIWADGAEYEYHGKYVEQVIKRYNPDFIIVTGDIVYGEFDDSGESLLEYIEFMDSFEIPWAPVFGNHDNESNMGADWQCEQFESSKYCLFKQRELTGNGNYTVGLVQGGALKRVFFMMDSNGCGGASAISMANGHTSNSIVGFANDQIIWYTETGAAIKETAPNVKFSFAFHIQLQVFADAFAKYGFTNSGTINNPIDIDTHSKKENGDFGYLGRDTKTAWDQSHVVWDSLKSMGVDSIFVGHEHCNSASVVYEGVRLQYGQKSSTYDRANYKQSNGTLVGSYSQVGEPVIGGTTIPILEETGEIVGGEIIYYDPNYQGEQPSQKQETLTLDFNGTDFSVSVSTPEIKSNAAKKVTDFSNVPSGYSGGVYSDKNRSSSHFSAIGIKFPKDVNLTKVLSLKLRMYVDSYTPISGKEGRVHLYGDKANTVLRDVNYQANGGKFGEWFDFDILPFITQNTQLSDGNKLLPFTFAYKFNTLGTPAIYFDCLSVEYIGDLYGFPTVDLEEEIETPKYAEEAWAVKNENRYTRYTLADVNVETLSLQGTQKKTYRVNDSSFSIGFNFTPTQFDFLSVQLLTDGYGSAGIGAMFEPNQFTVGYASFDYAFTAGNTYAIEVGIVAYEKDSQAGTYNGNTGYLFVKINDEASTGGNEDVWWYQIELFNYRKNFENNTYFTIQTVGGVTDEVRLDSYTKVEYRSVRGRELGREISKGAIELNAEKIAYYADGNEYLKVVADGNELGATGTTFTSGVHTVVFYFLQEPTEPQEPTPPQEPSTPQDPTDGNDSSSSVIGGENNGSAGKEESSSNTGSESSNLFGGCTASLSGGACALSAFGCVALGLLKRRKR